MGMASAGTCRACDERVGIAQTAERLTGMESRTREATSDRQKGIR